ncbi:MAG: hypothetical protein A2Y34_05995 [Spirochaetes bacterium GWC1_27_15]|nr:MAG: hypothetical protein A2Z98_17180 [Spirochaetes bacterium GWB1_27_13]OHD22337.1 MAG: hypothetical protein A2Y34_05995 [Spirochaetes bacterium GWC1_27_15]
MGKETQINLQKQNFSIGVKDKIFSIGSCFSISIQKYSNRNGIDILSNPFGTIYNTYSIYKELEILFNKNLYNETNLSFFNDKYFSFEHSNEFSSNIKSECLEKINNTIKESSNYIKRSNVFIITLGTSVVYISGNKIVANCHKIPQSNFTKKILTVEENISYLKDIIFLIKENINNPKIIFTLSPIRHSRNNLLENQLSKSVLRSAIENVINNKDVLYFPSYEIVIDELRDYKYYKEDGLHLKNTTIELIMQKFNFSFFEENLKIYIKDFNYCRNILKHKVKRPNSKEYFDLLKKILEKLKVLSEIRHSLIIEKIQFIVSKLIIEYFYTDKDVFKLFDNYLNYDIKNFFIKALSIKRNELKDLNVESDLSYTNKFHPYIKNYTKKLILQYYINKNDLENLKKYY